MKLEYKKNIWIYYLFKFLRQLTFFMPIYALFFIENGLSMSQVLLISTTIVISSQIFQIPTGIFADLYGRKKSVIIGAIFNFLAIFTYSIGTNFQTFIIGAIFMGIGVSFISGAFQAIIYDSLFELNKTKEYLKVEGRSSFYYGFAMVFAGIIGGIIAEKGLRLTYYLTLIPSFLAIITLFFLYEPKTHHKKEENFLVHYKDAYKLTITNKKILYLIFYFGINMTFMFIFFNFLQIYFTTTFEISKTYMGLLYSIFLLASAISGYFAHKIEEKFGDKKALILNPLLLFIGLIIVLFTKNIFLSIISVILFEFVWGFLNPLTSHYLNEVLHSKYRATILSFAGFVFGGFALILGPLFGWINDKYSFNIVFILLTILSLISLILSIYIIKNKKHK